MSRFKYTTITFQASRHASSNQLHLTGTLEFGPPRIPFVPSSKRRQGGDVIHDLTKTKLNQFGISYGCSRLSGLIIFLLLFSDK